MPLLSFPLGANLRASTAPCTRGGHAKENVCLRDRAGLGVGHGLDTVVSRTKSLPLLKQVLFKPKPFLLKMLTLTIPTPTPQHRQPFVVQPPYTHINTMARTSTLFVAAVAALLALVSTMAAPLLLRLRRGAFSMGLGWTWMHAYTSLCVYVCVCGCKRRARRQ